MLCAVAAIYLFTGDVLMSALTLVNLIAIVVRERGGSESECGIACKDGGQLGFAVLIIQPA